MKSKTYSFTTRRLLVKEWHSLSSDEWMEQDLAVAVSKMLTESVTRSLPPGWQGPYSIERAQQWIQERDGEGTTLLVVELGERKAVGLVILFESEAFTGSGVEQRLGYLFAERAWGKGFASELLLGYVAWCKQNGVESVVAGVECENIASRRVLEKVGFLLDSSTDEERGDELVYRLKL